MNNSAAQYQYTPILRRHDLIKLLSECKV